MKYALLVAALLGPVLPVRAESEAENPHIVYIIADDHDYEHFGFMNANNAVKTPNIDRLAKEGVVFDTAHQTASRCRPTLAGLLSGRFPHQNGIYGNDRKCPRLSPENTLPNLLKRAGYATWQGGKFWEGDPLKLGFGYMARDEYRSDMYTDTRKTFARKGQEDLFRFLGEHAPKRPVFLWWAPMMPHTPHFPPKRFKAMFPKNEIPVPDYVQPEFREEFLSLEQRLLAMVAWMDEEIGFLRERMEATCGGRDILYVYINDNGWANGLPSKGSVFEKGFRTPLVFTWKGTIPAGVTRHDLASSLDVYPTLLNIAGVDVPDSAEGIDLLPSMQKNLPVERSRLCGAMYPSLFRPKKTSPERDMYALYLRTSRWKYVLYTRAIVADEEPQANSLREGGIGGLALHHLAAEPPLREQGEVNLYDLEADPYELNDLSADPKHAETLAEFREELLNWWKETGGEPIPGI